MPSSQAGGAHGHRAIQHLLQGKVCRQSGDGRLHEPDTAQGIHDGNPPAEVIGFVYQQLAVPHFLQSIDSRDQKTGWNRSHWQGCPALAKAQHWGCCWLQLKKVSMLNNTVPMLWVRAQRRPHHSHRGPSFAALDLQFVLAGVATTHLL